jgi:hypothetical protein
MNLIGLNIVTVLALSSSVQLAAELEFDAVKDVRFWLLDRESEFNDDDDFSIDKMGSVKESSFDPTRPTVFQIHGYRERRQTEEHIKLSK